MNLFPFKNLISTLLAVGGLLALYPISLPNGNIFIKILQLCIGIILAIFLLRNKASQLGLLALLSFTFLSLSLSIVYVSPASWLTLGSLIFGLSLLISKDMLILAAKKFENLFCFILLIGLIIHFLVMSGVSLPYTIINIPHKELVGAYYKSYIFNVELLYLNSYSSFGRFCSVFDEPGVVGTFSALILIMRGLRFNNIRDYIFLISGIASLSAAFFILIVIGYLLKLRKKAGGVLILLTVITSFSFTLNFIDSSHTSDDSLVSRYFLNRFSNFETLNNRESLCFKKHFSKFLSSEDVLWGYGSNAASETGCDVSSPSILIFNYGFANGGLIIALNFAIFFLLYKKFTGKFFSINYLLLFIVPVAASFYQRPYIFHFTFILFLMIYIYRNENSPSYSDKY